MRNVLLILATLGLSAGVAFAADQPSSGGSRRAVCKDDVAKLCAGVQSGGGRIGACLKQNEAQLSPACKDALTKVQLHTVPTGSGAPQQSSPQK